MADSSGNTFLVLAIGVVGFAALYQWVPEVRKGINGIFGAFGDTGQPTTTASCSDLCKRRECSTYLNKCGTKGCDACNCGKLCSSAMCATLAAQCPGYTCSNCKGISYTGTNCRFATDPKNGAKYTMWVGTGCSGGYLRNNLEAAVPGTNCTAARNAFIKAYKCPSKYAYAYEASAYQNVTVA